MKQVKRKLRYDRIFIFALGVIIVSGLLFSIVINLFKPKTIPKDAVYMYISSFNNEAVLYDLEYNETSSVSRGKKVIIKEDKIENNGLFYYKVIYDNNDYYIKEENLSLEESDIVKEKNMYVKVPVTVYENDIDSKISSFIKKGNSVEIVGYDKLNEDGTVNMYKIKKDDITGYIYSKYLTLNESDLEIENEYTKYHENREFAYELYGGDSNNLDYSYREKPNFENNIMPTEAKTLYLTGSKWILSDIDKYIDLAKNSGINSFVVDIKDGYMAYESDVAKKYSITNYKSYSNTKEEYKNAINKLKNAGFYVIGRIVVFNDSNFAKDNPNETISNTSWVSAYSRLAWEFNVLLAKEAVSEFGFNEIQFDYVRFPEASYSYSKNNYNFKNKYNEDKAEAIQNFLIYATDELHKLNVYVSADVFGECVGTYVTAYGQYWPAISNVVDVISAMPYPDHFSKGSYGISIPWEKPYSLMKNWASYAVKRQTEIPSPARVRTWIQAYDAIKSPYITYDASMIEYQIKGLYDAGLSGGFITWNGGASFNKYQAISSAFGKDY